MSGNSGGGMFVVENYGWLKILVKIYLRFSSLKSQENNVYIKTNTLIAKELSDLEGRGTQPVQLFIDQ